MFIYIVIQSQILEYDKLKRESMVSLFNFIVINLKIRG